MRKIEIIDEENSIIIDNQYDTTDFTFYPEDKKFYVGRSVKDDCFFSNQIIEYKISTDPIEIQMRTLESSSEPPKEYSIKDGVVLESELKKEKMLAFFPDRVKNLKKDVEWNAVPLLGGYCEVNLYILSKHPEIISKENYRKFLRQTEERIKIGLSKIEKYLKENKKSGLKVIDGEYGRTIMYPDYKPTSEEEDKKKFNIKEEVYKNLFNEKSSNYCGLSEEEFIGSLETLEYLDKILNKKEVFSAPIEKEEHKGNNAKWIAVIVISLVALYWGIWTAIGVFILGNIIVALLFPNQSNT